MANYYQTLGLSHGASESELRGAYLRLARELHPDLHPGEPGFTELFKRLQEAWRVLRSPELREAYDDYLHGFEDEGHSEEAGRRLKDFNARLYTELEIRLNVAEALLGCSKSLSLPFRDPEGHTLLRHFTLQIPPGALDGQGLPLPLPGAEEELGLRLKLRVLVPENLSRRQKKLLAEFASLEDPSAYPRRQSFLNWSQHA